MYRHSRPLERRPMRHSDPLLDELADHMTYPVARVPRRAPIDCATALVGIIAHRIRRHVTCPAIPCEFARDGCFVTSHRIGMIARHAIEQPQCARAMCRAAPANHWTLSPT